MVWCLNPGMVKRFSFLRSMQTGSVANPVSCSMHTRVLSGGGGVDNSPPSSAKVKNEWSYSSAPPVCLQGIDGDNFTF